MPDDAPPPSGMVRLTATNLLVASLLTLTTSSQGLLTTASKTGTGYSYNYATVPFLAECLKLIISSYLLSHAKSSGAESPRISRNAKGALLFVLPSVIYWLHNNVQFATLTFVDPATYQILGNLKIVTTGLFFWIFLRRSLIPLQWIALILLTAGATTSQLRTSGKGTNPFGAPVEGYLLGGLSAVLSAVAAIYTEWVMKRNNDSLHWQNTQLYSFGVVVNAFGLTVSDIYSGYQNGFWLIHIVDGYTFVTVLVVFNLACSGLLVSYIMKYADSIMKVYATSMAMLVTMAVSILLFNLTMTLQLFLGIVITSCSVVLYYVPPATLAQVHSPTTSAKAVLPR